MTAPPTGTVTFLFTDLEGSTRLWEEQPDAMQGALARHDTILRDAVESRRGHVVKMTGDGLHAAFATAEEAVAAALAAQQSLHGESWGPTGPLLVRMGVHTGAAEARDGDYFGSSVNRAARLMSAAHGGQIVVSHATEELVRDDLGNGVSLVDLGEHRLRDLSRAERVFQLSADGLATGFPPLRSIDAFPGNLPQQLTSFVGRDNELRAIGKALHEARLVTLTGVGGVGKTRLAIHVAAEVVPSFPAGAWVCELAAANEPESMVQVIATTLGVQPRSGTTLEGSILEFIGTKSLVLVLDNCEHLLDAAGRFAERVLQECPAARILATSREGLAVPGEQVWALRSLRVPDARDTGSATSDGAVALFVDRAHSVRSDFELDDNNETAVVEICRRLDGIPLAIELAAARTAAMTPTEIAELLDERFRLLTGGRRTAVERHQTLRATVDWSYAQLSDTERMVFDRLGVFAGSFDARAASAVVAGDGVESFDVLDALGALVAKSLVVAERTADDRTRYQMLETLRHYARERLDDESAGDDWRRRHGAYYAELAERIGTELVGPDELASRAALIEEIDNLRAVTTWSLDRDDDGDFELGLHVIASLADEGALRNRESGIAEWAERAAAHDARISSELRPAVMACASANAFFRADYATARLRAESALRGTISPLTRQAMLPHAMLAMIEAMLGDPARGVALMENAKPSVLTGDSSAANRSMFHIFTASLAILAGEVDVAQGHSDLALRFAQEARNPTLTASSLCMFGWSRWTDDEPTAVAALTECVEMIEGGRATKAALPTALSRLAPLRARMGDAVGAYRALRDAAAYSANLGQRPDIASTLLWGIVALDELGQYEVAAVMLGMIRGPLASMFRGFASGPERAEYEHAFEHVEVMLGCPTFSTTVALGSAMHYEQIVSYVLSEFDRLIDEAASTFAHGAGDA
jgi:predicted ATPase/class 3 adenylate cyclase